MKTSSIRPIFLPLIIFIAGVLCSGCVAPGYGYGYGGYAVDYYEPYGGIYGEWGPGYNVGPYRDGRGRQGPYSGGHAYRSAPASHPMPSIPMGGGHGGGNRH
jgi:hypothetical protein